MRRWMLTSLVFVTWAGWPMTGHSSFPQSGVERVQILVRGQLNGLGIIQLGTLPPGLVAAFGAGYSSTPTR